MRGERVGGDAHRVGGRRVIRDASDRQGDVVVTPEISPARTSSSSSRFRRRLPLGCVTAVVTSRDDAESGDATAYASCTDVRSVVTLALYESVSGSNAGVSVATSPTNDSAESFGDAPADATRREDADEQGEASPMEPAGATTAAVATSGRRRPASRPAPAPVSSSRHPRVTIPRHERCTPPPRTLSAHFANSNGQAESSETAHFSSDILYGVNDSRINRQK